MSNQQNSNVDQKGIVERIAVFIMPIIAIAGVYMDMNNRIIVLEQKVAVNAKVIDGKEVDFNKMVDRIDALMGKITILHDDLSVMVAFQASSNKDIRRRLVAVEGEAK